jgi:hypothetical protein
MLDRPPINERGVSERGTARRREAGVSARAFPLAAAAFLIGVSGAARAHGFGQRYDLPVPLWLYLFGAAAVVAVSFLIVGLFVRGTRPTGAYPRANLLRSALGRAVTRGSVVLVVKCASVGLFTLVVAAGLWGEQNPLRNLAPTMVWVIWWLGLAYFSVLIGNLWSLINPWATLFGWSDALYRRLRPGCELSYRLPYPEALGVWPAVGLLLAFSWMELIFPDPAAPANVAWLLIDYSVVAWSGMLLFGRERWLARGDPFSLLFGVLAHFSPTEIGVLQPKFCATCGLGCLDRQGECIDCRACFAQAKKADRVLALRPYAVGLLRNQRIPLSLVAFVLLLLATVLFDGLLATPAWTSVEDSLYPLVPTSDDMARITIETSGFVLFWLLFLGIYLATCWIMSAATEYRLAPLELAGSFAFTLIPIAIAYHVAHYLSFLVIQGQYLIPLLSDPFGNGWDLLGTAGYRVNVSIVGPKFAWYAAVSAIVAGHVVAVCLAHVKAIRVLGDRHPALRSQYPLTALMVAYTVVSLSILAEPIVERRPGGPHPAEVVGVPAEAIIPQAGSGRLQKVGPGTTARARLTYRVLESNFHDGTRMTAADILYPYIFAYRWGTPSVQVNPAYDPYVDAATALLRQHLVGLRVTGVDKTSKSISFGDVKLARELLIVEVYLDGVPKNPEQAAAIAPPWSTLPWPVIVLMEEAVKRGWAAFSREEAVRRSVEWLDLARSDPLKRRLATLVEQFERLGYVPDALKAFVSVEEARARWAALDAFERQNGHFLVTNGPYVLSGWSHGTAVLEAFRDMSYPLGIGSFDSLPIPHRAYITRVERHDESLKIFADVERVVKFQRSYKILRGPLQRKPDDIVRPEVPECRYAVVDAHGIVVLTGAGHLEADSTFGIDLHGKLKPDVYTVMLMVYVNGNMMNPEIKRLSYAAPGG